MKLLDISRVISGSALVYPGDPAVRLTPLCEAPFRLTALGLTTHVLTHLDAPRHFFPSGAAISDLPLERFCGPAEVVPADGPCIQPAHVPEHCRGMAVLFKTRHSGPWAPEYDRSHVFIAPETARLLVDRGATLAGIDYLSVDRFGDESYPTHHILLGAGMPILEGLDLAAAAPGRYTLFAFPLRIEDGDGSPVRAVLAPLQ